MKNILKSISTKIIAAVLVGLTFMSPLSGVAYAAPKHSNHPPKQVQHMSHVHKKQPVVRHVHHKPAPRLVRHEVRHVHHEPPRYVVHRDRHHDEVGVLVGGLILGTIIGAAIADANSSN